jgi:RNA polymerase sigma-70 factor, ECF subfamily
VGHDVPTRRTDARGCEIGVISRGRRVVGRGGSPDATAIAFEESGARSAKQGAKRERREVHFGALYQLHYRPLRAYVLRRTDASEADDVVAECFLVLWRRLEAAPSRDDEVLLWLFGVARHVLSNFRRSRVRRERLAARITNLRHDLRGSEIDGTSRCRARAVVEGLLQLDPDDREILLLAGWERLSNLEIGKILGCSQNAAALRLHRARRRLTEVYEER